MNLKVCGMRDAENVKAVAELRPQMMGFIFVPSSPRYFYNSTNPANLNFITGINKAGVFVNQGLDEILEQVKLHALDFAQLHGQESIEFCKLLSAHGIKVIKAFNVHPGFDFTSISDYAPYAEHFLFDAAGKSSGGNGIKFDWELLKNYRFKRPFILSGGIGPDDIETLKTFQHPDMWGIDINSRFELSPGLKTVEALKLFKQQIDAYEAIKK